MTTTTKRFDYAAFVDALRELLTLPRISGGIDEPMHSQNHGFLLWKQRLVFLLEQIERQGYSAAIKIRGRSFDMPGFTPRQSILEPDILDRQNRWFQNASAETDAEISAVIYSFDKYGPPDASVPHAIENLTPAPDATATAVMPKPFDYAAFVNELRILRDSYANPPSNHRTCDSGEFKQWRHQVSDLIGRIELMGYNINCRINSRQFRVIAYAVTSTREQQAAFDKAHADTMIELNTIISNFEKYGDPHGTSRTPVQTPSPSYSAPIQTPPLEWTKDATLMWYLKNTPLRTLWTFGTIFVAAMGAAFWTGTVFEKRWPEAKPPVATNNVSDRFQSEVQKPTASQPISAPPVVQTPIDGHPSSTPQVQSSRNEQLLNGQGKLVRTDEEQLSTNSDKSASQTTSTPSK